MMDEFGQWMMVLTNYHNLKRGFKRNMNFSNIYVYIMDEFKEMGQLSTLCNG
jgi:hypothetical protein